MRTVLTVAVVGIGLFLSASPASSQDAGLPEGPAKAKIEAACSGCHAVTMVTSQRRSTAQWADTVDQMIARGAQVSDEDYKIIVDYLGKNFAPVAKPDVTPTK